MRPWRPLFTGKRADRARRALDVVSRRLLGQPVLERLRALAEPQQAALFGGLPGIALANYALSRCECIAPEQAERHADLAEAHLQRSVETIEQLGGDGGLSRGVAGLALAIEWTNDPDGSEADDVEYDINADVDYALSQELGRHMDLPAELMNGLAGRAIYARARWHRPSGRALLTSIADRLIALAVPDGDGVAWRSPADPRYAGADMREQYPDGWFDLGVAHGQPAVIAALASCPDHARAHELARAGMTWMWNRALPDGIAAFAAIDGEEPMDASGWCYGDEGTAASLYAASLALGDRHWQARWLDILRRATNRETVTRRSLTLCHGAAGLGHIFNRIYQHTGHPPFAEAAFGWFDALFGTLEATGEARPYPSSALLEGDAGVALAISATLVDREPFWDRALALSLP